MHYLGSRARAAAFFMLVAATSAPVLADYKAGVDALAVRDYATARAQFEREPDNANAIYQLSRMATLGLGEPRNETRAAALLRRAADAGSLPAKLDLVYALGNGTGVARDTAQAVRILEELSTAGNVEAALILGRALYYGWWELKKDEARASGLFQRAMDAGNDNGTTMYAITLLSGNGVAKDEARGAELLKLASDRGNTAAQIEYASLLTRGTAVTRDYAAAAALYRKAAETGHANAQYGVALAYWQGWGVPREAATAVRWADAAAQQGNNWAQLLLGDAFNSGVGVPRNRTEAVYWYTVASRGGTSASERANERRVILAKDMPQADIDNVVKRADAYTPQAGVRPRQEALPALAHGDSVQIGSVKLDVPAPRGYTNGWQTAEWVQQMRPNDPELRPLLMVLTRQEDMDRVKLSLPGPYRNIEIGRYGADPAVAVTPAMFADIRKQMRDQVQAAVAAGKYRLDKVVADDDRAYALVRSGISQANRVDGFALLLLKQRVLVLMFTGYRTEHLAELQDLVKDTVSELASSNRGGFFSQQ
ncbi:tetratricopeptide repeat protein [Caenimonas aquaedulcis]|uniref:Sel1 repeat family protein n=1 Tax=Caenimonas aquaedulcis TaxID=2793270 RepID=A0A931MI98_9BURK|nr:tetratricopeptide repeat protein [Caenimonas aquaedulcis]MBG9389614.1 sel1 repeat family protein [Caenimonas aquaedulcis]